MEGSCGISLPIKSSTKPSRTCFPAERVRQRRHLVDRGLEWPQTSTDSANVSLNNFTKTTSQLPQRTPNIYSSAASVQKSEFPIVFAPESVLTIVSLSRTKTLQVEKFWSKWSSTWRRKGLLPPRTHARAVCGSPSLYLSRLCLIDILLRPFPLPFVIVEGSREKENRFSGRLGDKEAREVREAIAHICSSIETQAWNGDARCNFAVSVCRGLQKFAILRLWRAWWTASSSESRRNVSIDWVSRSIYYIKSKRFGVCFKANPIFIYRKTLRWGWYPVLKLSKILFNKNIIHRWRCSNLSITIALQYLFEASAVRRIDVDQGWVSTATVLSFSLEVCQW